MGASPALRAGDRAIAPIPRLCLATALPGNYVAWAKSAVFPLYPLRSQTLRVCGLKMTSMSFLSFWFLQNKPKESVQPASMPARASAETPGLYVDRPKKTAAPKTAAKPGGQSDKPLL
jgi:hypothetical protein